jgi:hypothetical protein
LIFGGTPSTSSTPMFGVSARSATKITVVASPTEASAPAGTPTPLMPEVLACVS